MCGRIIQHRGPHAYADLLGIAADDAVASNAPPHYNGAPGQDLLVMRRNAESGRIEIGLLRWGLLPHWAKDPKLAWRLINARSETVKSTAAFRQAWDRKRLCAIPVDGFYEWRKDGKVRQPFAIARRDRLPFALAGLWENWCEPETGAWRRTFTILTCAANPAIAVLHDRMPVILADADVPRWLAGEDPEPLLRPLAEDVLELWPVSTRVNSGREDDEALIEPISGVV